MKGLAVSLKPSFFQAIRAQAEHMRLLSELEGLLQELLIFHTRKANRMDKIMSLDDMRKELELHARVAKTLEQYVEHPK